MDRPPAEQPIAFMGPPILVDRQRDFALSQMPAIALYLGEQLHLLPAAPEGRALTAKVANDANDVIDELTLDGGREMWTTEKWEAFAPRLQKWMRIFETLGERHGLTADGGFLLGTAEPGVADLVTATLWSTMADRFPKIARLGEQTAPAIWGLARRLQETPRFAALKQKSLSDYGDAYCGGEIEASLRKVAG
jgi:glutathione S-transferase